LEAVKKVQKQWYPKVWSDWWLHPYSVYEGISTRTKKEDTQECPIHPLSLLSQVWNSFHFLFATLFSLLIPITLAFPNRAGDTLPLVLSWTLMQLCDTLYLLNTGVIIEQELDMLPKSVFRYHWKAGHLWSNLITGFPYIVIVDSLTAPASIYRSFGRLICIVNAAGVIQSWTANRASIIRSKMDQIIRYYEWNQSLVKSVQITGGIAFYCHWFSCAVRFLQRYSYIHDYVNSPIESEYYITSFFESASIMFSAAWGVTPPMDTYERWPKVINMLMSTFLYALFTANITAFMVRLDSSGRLFSEKLEEVNQYLQYKGVGRDVHERIIKYFRFKYSQGKYFDQDRILGELNEPLRVAISMRECRSLIMSVPFFKDADQQFVSQVVTLLRIHHYLEDDLILERDTTGDQMFFIETGHVEVVLRGKTVAVLGPGDYFGEISLLFGHMKRTASVRAISNCVLYSLSQSELEKILELNPDMANKMRDSAEERIRMNQVVIMAPASPRSSFVPFMDQTYQVQDVGSSQPRLSAVRAVQTSQDNNLADIAVQEAQKQSFVTPLIDPALLRNSVVIPNGATPPTIVVNTDTVLQVPALVSAGSGDPESKEASTGSLPIMNNSQEKLPIRPEMSLGPHLDERMKSASFRLKDANSIFSSSSNNVERTRSGPNENSSQARGRNRSGTLTNRRGLEIHSIKGNIPAEPPKNEVPALPLLGPSFLSANLDPNGDPNSRSLHFIQVDDSPARSRSTSPQGSQSVVVTVDPTEQKKSNTSLSGSQAPKEGGFGGSLTENTQILPSMISKEGGTSPRDRASFAETKKKSFLGTNGSQTSRASPLRFATNVDSTGDLSEASNKKIPTVSSQEIVIQVENDSVTGSVPQPQSGINPFADPSSPQTSQVREHVPSTETAPKADISRPKPVHDRLANVLSAEGLQTSKANKAALKKGLKIVTNSSDNVNMTGRAVGFALSAKPLDNSSSVPSLSSNQKSASSFLAVPGKPDPLQDLLTPLSPKTPFIAPEVQQTKQRRKTFADITIGREIQMPPPKWTWKRFWNKYQPSITYCPLHPDMLVSKIWNAILQLAFLCVVLLLPVTLGFRDASYHLRPLSIFVTVLSSIDFVIKMQTGLPVYDEFEMDPRKLATIYLKNGTFVLDFITTVPWVFVVDAIASDETTRDFARLICLVHTLPFLRCLLDSRRSILAELFTKFIRKNDINVSAVQAVKILFAIIFYWHWHSCSANYIMRMQLVPDPFPTLTGIHGYILHFWASATEMLNAGCGAVPPAVSLDRVLKVVNMVFNATLVALYVGNISSFMIGLDSSGRQFNEQLEQVSQFVTYKGLGRELKRKIFDYYQFKYAQGKYFDETRILQELNESLRMVY
jgi:CRP-like cAMP-binding protein